MLLRQLNYFTAVVETGSFTEAAAPQRSAAEEAIVGLRGFLRCLPGAKEMGIVYGTGAWGKSDALRHPAYEKAFEMGRSVGT